MVLDEFETRHRVEGSGLNAGAKRNHFFFPTTVHTDPGPHQTSFSMGTIALQQGKALTTQPIYRRGSE